MTFPNIDITTSSSLSSTSLKNNDDRFIKSVILSQPIITLSKNQISSLQNDVLLWTYNGNGDNNSHNDIPNPPNSFAIRACGIVPMKPCDLYNLLLDSKRNKEYNLYSCGRNDVWVHDFNIKNTNDNVYESNDDDYADKDFDLGLFGNDDCFEKNHHYQQQKRQQTDMHQSDRITKVCNGSNKPPLVRKPIPYMSLIHGQEIDTSSPSKGYILSTRSAYQVDSNGVMKNLKSYATEIIIGSSLFLPISIDDNDDSIEEGNHQSMTLFINANLVKSPLPYCITKKVGLSGAVNFVNWLRALC